MNRRGFLMRIGGVLVAVPAVLHLTGCGDDGGGSPDANLGAQSFQGQTQDSSGHSHGVTVQCADLDGTTATYTSTDGGGHTHQVTLNASQLSALASGETVMVETTDVGHTHTWVIAKGNAC